MQASPGGVLHTIGVPVHCPLVEQLSATVQGLPSSQPAPLTIGIDAGAGFAGCRRGHKEPPLGGVLHAPQPPPPSPDAGPSVVRRGHRLRTLKLRSAVVGGRDHERGPRHETARARSPDRRDHRCRRPRDCTQRRGERSRGTKTAKTDLGPGFHARRTTARSGEPSRKALRAGVSVFSSAALRLAAVLGEPACVPVTTVDHSPGTTRHSTRRRWRSSCVRWPRAAR